MCNNDVLLKCTLYMARFFLWLEFWYIKGPIGRKKQALTQVLSLTCTVRCETEVRLEFNCCRRLPDSSGRGTTQLICFHPVTSGKTAIVSVPKCVVLCEALMYHDLHFVDSPVLFNCEQINLVYCVRSVMILSLPLLFTWRWITDQIYGSQWREVSDHMLFFLAVHAEGDGLAWNVCRLYHHLIVPTSRQCGQILQCYRDKKSLSVYLDT